MSLSQNKVDCSVHSESESTTRLILESVCSVSGITLGLDTFLVARLVRPGGVKKMELDQFL